MTEYEKAVERAKQQIGNQERWIFEDTEGNFQVIHLVDGDNTMNHYCHVAKWVPRGRVFTETKVTTMWTGVVIPKK